jgi:hypothetical protein
MKRIKALIVGLACCAALTVSAAGLALSAQQNTNQNTEACCDMKNCCKDGAMSCCKKKNRKGKNAHACCKGKDSAESCCCKGDSCPMPNKKASNSKTN